MKKYSLLILLVLACAVRLYHINSPIIGVHSWRQADTAAIARNFYENGYKFLYPQIDWGGASAGHVESEFPLYSFVVALFYQLSGVQEFWGRLLSVIFSLVSIYFLYLLVKKFTDSNTAFWSAFFYGFLPLNIFYSRTFMPESAMLLCSILGVYLFSVWLDAPKLRYFLLSLIFIALAGLLKISNLYLGLPLFYLAWLKFGKKVIFQWSLWVYAVLVFLAVGLWYYHAHQIFLESGLSFNIWGYGTDKWGNWNLVATREYWTHLFFSYLTGIHFTWIGFPIFFTGLFLKTLNQKEKLFDFWLLGVLVFFVIVGRGNFVHEYYQLPFMIPAAVYMGKVYGRYFDWKFWESRKALILAVALLGILAFGSQRYFLYLKAEDPETSEIFKLAQQVKEKTEKNSLVVAVDGNDPTLLYLCHRKGWHFLWEEADEKFLKEKIQKGAKYVTGIYGYLDEARQQKLKILLSNYELLWEEGDSFIVKLAD